MHADADAFLETIRERPDDDGPRLIYADYLEDKGDPRGPFIRIQCALAKLGEADPRRAFLEERERFLLEANRHIWSNSFRGLTSAEEFQRGFVETVNIEARVLLLRTEQLFRLAPIQHLRLLDAAGLLPEVMACSQLQRLTEITVNMQHLGDGLTLRVGRVALP